MGSKYNATVKQIYPSGAVGTFVAHVIELGGRLQMTRSNAVQFTRYDDMIGKLPADSELAAKYTGDEVALYDIYMRETHPGSTFEIDLDNCEGYRNAISGLALPPAYKGE